MTRRLVALASLTVALAIGSTAGAQPQSEKAQAAWRLEEGKRALAKGDLDKAITAFEEAHTVLRQPTSGVPLAQALVKKGRLADALSVARAVQATPKAGKEAFSVTKARADADALAAELDKRVPKLRTSAPDGTAVTVDGRDVPLDDGVRRVDPGDHTVEGKLGDKRASATVKLAEGDDKTVTLEFGSAPPAAGASPPASNDQSSASWRWRALAFGSRAPLSASSTSSGS